MLRLRVGAKQIADEIRADKTGSAGDKNILHNRLSRIILPGRRPIPEDPWGERNGHPCQQGPIDADRRIIPE